MNFDAVCRDFHSLQPGMGLCLELALNTIVIGCDIGIANEFDLLSSYKALRNVASIYVTVVRNTPKHVIIQMIYIAQPD
ncbi:amino acid ABC transporter permease, partial [Pseudomonas syringae pv. tagetis]